LETPLFEPQKYSRRPAASKVLDFFLNLMETFVLAAVLFVVLNAALARVRIESISMEPTLYRGELVAVNKLATFMGGYKRGDVIVFAYPPDPSQQYIKRVIGLPGDQVLISKGRVFVNGVAVREPYTMAQPDYTGVWNIPDGSLFVLGDNRNHSNDSHVWGMLPLERVVGSALFIYWPPQQAGVIRGTPALQVRLQ